MPVWDAAAARGFTLLCQSRDGAELVCSGCYALAVQVMVLLGGQ